MMNKLSMRWRITLLNMLLLIGCCVGLTFTLNLSANKMADVLEATPLMPSMQVGEDGLPVPNEQDEAISMAPTIPSGNSKIARMNFLYNSIFYMLIIVCVGGLATYYIAGKALKPLSELSEQMKNLTVHNLSQNLSVPQSSDEIAQLTISFNQMSNKLDDAFAMQKRFSQSAAHELRTPLTVLKTKIDVFSKKHDRTKEEYKNLVEVFSANTNRLSALVNDLLSLTNMDEVKLSDEIILSTLFEEIIYEVTPIATEKQVAITLLNNAENQIITGNKNLLHRAFYNLVENAVKYNVQNGSVEISLDIVESKNIISIKDSGISIPDEMKNLIFEPFFRVDKSRNRKIAGSGLGLSTVRTILDKHSGEIIVSDNVGSGSIFKVML